MNDRLTEDGEIVSAFQLDTSPLTAIARAEIDSQIATARAYPRVLKRVINSVLSLVLIDEETAEECIYALPRGGKPIPGFSIRGAEIVAQQYGNCRFEARVVAVDRVEKVVVAEGTFLDLETNMGSRAEVRRRIVDSKGRLYNDDMIVVTGNAACAIAKRNAILAGVPRPVWRKAYEEARRIVAGDASTLTATRDKALAALAHYGLKPEQIFTVLGVESAADITLAHIPDLRGMFAALKNGETTVEELLRTSRGSAGTAHEKVVDPLANVPRENAQSGPETGGKGDDANPGGAGSETQPARQQQASAGGQAADQKGEQDKAPEPPKELTPEELQAFWDKGHKRGKAGGSRAIPKELQKPEMKAAADKYLDGYDTARAEAEGGGDA